MKNLWDEREASDFSHSDLSMRVYTSRLLGREEDLVLQGGGNTSVKVMEEDIFGEKEELLYIKGSGWNLKTIEEEGFSPCRLEKVEKLATLPSLSDQEMVRELKTSMVNPKSPSPSVETILHAIIPFKYVDHTHADAVVTISNTPGGDEKIHEIYGEGSLILPYVMPGFDLAKQIYEATQNVDWNKIESIILLHHGVFTFSESGKESYEKMIKVAEKAEDYLKAKNAWTSIKREREEARPISPLSIAKMRKLVSEKKGSPMLLSYKNDERSMGFSSLDVGPIATRGPITPDHVISTKRVPLVIDDENETEVENALNNYIEGYYDYFNRNKEPDLTCLDPLPRWGVMKERGVLVFSPTFKLLNRISDITDHTMKCIQWGEELGGWKPLDEKNIFDVEYWELEQAKLNSAQKRKEQESKVALVTGAASGIGKACTQDLARRGCAVIALDVDPEIESMFPEDNVLALQCDLTQTEEIKDSLAKGVCAFGGVDYLVSNAGIFPLSQKIEELDNETWEKALGVNLDSHMKLLRELVPFLKVGLDPAVVFVGSKNVAAPGPGASAYSVSKAGLTQLARVAAFELGEYGIRVNTVHPDAVYDTAIWTEDVLKQRAQHYGLSVEEYKKNNILKTDINSDDISQLVSDLLSKTFSKTTGAQIPIDGGKARVI